MQTSLSRKVSFQVEFIEGRLTHFYTILLFPFDQLSSVLDAEQLTFKYKGGWRLAWTVSVDLAA